MKIIIVNAGKTFFEYLHLLEKVQQNIYFELRDNKLTKHVQEEQNSSGGHFFINECGRWSKQMMIHERKVNFYI